MNLYYKKERFFGRIGFGYGKIYCVEKDVFVFWYGFYNSYCLLKLVGMIFEVLGLLLIFIFF